MNKIPYMLIVGEQEEKDGTVSVRRHSEGDIGTFAVSEFSQMLQKEVKKDIKEFK